MTDQELLQAIRSVVREEIAPVKEDVAVLKTDVAELKTDVSKLKTDVSDLQVKVANLEEEYDSMQKDIDEIKDNTLITREVCNELVEWTERAGNVIGVPFMTAAGA